MTAATLAATLAAVLAAVLAAASAAALTTALTAPLTRVCSRHRLALARARGRARRELTAHLGTLPSRAPPAQQAAGGREGEQRGGAAHGGQWQRGVFAFARGGDRAPVAAGGLQARGRQWCTGALLRGRGRRRQRRA